MCRPTDQAQTLAPELGLFRWRNIEFASRLLKGRTLVPSEACSPLSFPRWPTDNSACSFIRSGSRISAARAPVLGPTRIGQVEPAQVSPLLATAVGNCQQASYTLSAKRRSTPGGITGLGLRLTLADQWRRKMYTALRSSTSVSSNSCSGLASAVYDSISSVNVRLFCVGARKPPIPAASIGACRLINVVAVPRHRPGRVRRARWCRALRSESRRSPRRCRESPGSAGIQDVVQLPALCSCRYRVLSLIKATRGAIRNRG